MIQQMGILLRLPQVVLASAQVMFHRFYARRSVKKFDVRHFAMGALFLAAKVEEQPRKTRDVVNVANHLEQRRAGQAPQPVDIFSQRYATYKDRLVKAERELLKELGFILYTEHPHKFILNYAKLLTVDEGTSKRLAQHAWNFINDSQRTDACIKHAPEVICCAAIFMSARVLQLKLPSGWWELFDAQKDEMDAVVAQISALYSRPPARYVRLQPDPEPPSRRRPRPRLRPRRRRRPLPRRRPRRPRPRPPRRRSRRRGAAPPGANGAGATTTRRIASGGGATTTTGATATATAATITTGGTPGRLRPPRPPRRLRPPRPRPPGPPRRLRSTRPRPRPRPPGSALSYCASKFLRPPAAERGTPSRVPCRSSRRARRRSLVATSATRRRTRGADPALSCFRYSLGLAA